MRILAVDYGDRRLGIAVSDPEGIFAFPLTVIDLKKNKDWKSELKRIIQEKGVEKIVVGLPLTLKGEEGRLVKNVKDFCDLLRAELGLPVELVDERFTSEIARKTLHSEGKSEKQIRGKLDMYSSAQLLQTYLDIIRRENRK